MNNVEILLTDEGFTGFNLSAVFIAANDMTTEGAWEWGVGEGNALDADPDLCYEDGDFYTNWNDGEPNNVGDEDCAT